MIPALFALLGGCGQDRASECHDVEDPGPRRLRRLTHEEYRRTVQDLLGLDATLARSFAGDPAVHGFRNDVDSLDVDGLLADQYRTSAEDLAARVEVGALVSCAPDATEDACAAGFVRDFGARAFRRPLGTSDVLRYLEVYRTVASDSDFETGIRWVVAAMLQSPHFLYRPELGILEDRRGGRGIFRLTDWETASVLSYGLWGTMPDPDLFDAASAGRLTSDDDVAAAVDRMLDDPRAVDGLTDFVEAWLDLGPLATVSREGLDDGVRQALQDDLRSWVEAHRRGLLVDVVAEDGLLTHPAVLTTHGRPDGSSPVHRGVMVRERLLCEELPPPPPNLDTSPPPVDPTLSTRDRFAAHADDPACSGCHVRIDPLGFAFEHYDQLGAWRSDDAGHPIDDAGHLDGVPFEGPEGLGSALLADPRFRRCFVSSWRRHVLGTDVCGSDPGPSIGLVDPLLQLLDAEFTRVREGAREEGDTFAVGTLHGGADDPRDPGDGPTKPESPSHADVEITIQSDWGEGYCADGRVENRGEAPITWEARWPRDGAIDNVWDARVEDVGPDWRFVGPEGRTEIDPGDAATFGFCASRS